MPEHTRGMVALPDTSSEQHRIPAAVLPAADVRASTDAITTTVAPSASLLTLAMLEATPRGQRVTGYALVLRSDAAVDRSGQPYLMLTLQGADGSRVAARWWRYPYPIERRPAPGQVYTFTGTSDRYGDELQLRLVHVQAAPAALDDLQVFSRTTRRTREELTAALDARIATLDADLAALVRAVLHGEIYERYCTWPAAQYRHGAVRHGLLAHSLHVAIDAGLELSGQRRKN